MILSCFEFPIYREKFIGQGTRGSFKEISTDDRLTLREIKGTKNLDFISNVELEIKWIADHQSLKHIGVGGEFLNISEEIRQQIDQFVDTMRLLGC